MSRLRNLRLPAWWCRVAGHADWGDEFNDLDLLGNLAVRYYCGRCGDSL